MADTHINAYYAELQDAELAESQAKGRVSAAKEAIRSMGGVVPGEEKAPAKPKKTKTVSKPKK